jgi:hypothetical protein
LLDKFRITKKYVPWAGRHFQKISTDNNPTRFVFRPASALSAAHAAPDLDD